MTRPLSDIDSALPRRQRSGAAGKVVVNIVCHKSGLNLPALTQSVPVIRQDEADTGDQHIRAGGPVVSGNGEDLHTPGDGEVVLQLGQDNSQGHAPAGAHVQQIDIQL